MSGGPLAGVRVVDLTTVVVGPICTRTLADYGADVIKVEPPIEGDPHRHNWKNPGYPQSDRNFPWQLDGRHKRSLSLYLKNPEARPVLERLIARADVMIVNFPPPARERLKLRWEDVQPLNPRLVYCSLTGYGESGPDRDRPGFDISAYFGRSGILDAARYEERMAFEDPLTRYDTLSGYLFNIQMLRRVFAPTIHLHDVKRTGELELTTRWTMGMRLAANPLQVRLRSCVVAGVRG